jgi:hypothetical protein
MRQHQQQFFSYRLCLPAPWAVNFRGAELFKLLHNPQNIETLYKINT